MEYLLEEYIRILEKQLVKTEKAIEDMTVKNVEYIEIIPFNEEFFILNTVISDLKRIEYPKIKKSFSYWDKV